MRDTELETCLRAAQFADECAKEYQSHWIKLLLGVGWCKGMEKHWRTLSNFWWSRVDEEQQKHAPEPPNSDRGPYR